MRLDLSKVRKGRTGDILSHVKASLIINHAVVVVIIGAKHVRLDYSRGCCIRRTQIIDK